MAEAEREGDSDPQVVWLRDPSYPENTIDHFYICAGHYLPSSWTGSGLVSGEPWIGITNSPRDKSFFVPKKATIMLHYGK